MTNENPIPAEIRPMAVMRSDRKRGDSRITQMGVVNSKAKSWARGISGIAKNQRF